MMVLTNLVAILVLWTGGDTLHAQEVRYRSSVTDWQKGTIVVTEDAITFDATKADFPEMYRLSINRDDVIAVKREWYYLFPNRFVIETKDGEKYKFFTYKRKQIIRTIRGAGG